MVALVPLQEVNVPVDCQIEWALRSTLVATPPLQLTVVVVASDACIEAAVVVASVVQFAFDGRGDSELAEIG